MLESQHSRQADHSAVFQQGRDILRPTLNDTLYIGLKQSQEGWTMSSATTKSTSLANSRRVIGTDTSALPGHSAKADAPATTRRKAKTVGISYQRNRGVDAYVRAVAGASPMEIIAIERQGVLGAFINDLSKRMEIPTSRICSILGVSTSMLETKMASRGFIDGCAGQSAVRMIKLLGIAQTIVSNSTAVEARKFDSAKWLGRWIERTQPALGGRKPAELIDTPMGVLIVARLLGSIESGAYQ